MYLQLVEESCRRLAARARRTGFSKSGQDFAMECFGIESDPLAREQPHLRPQRPAREGHRRIGRRADHVHLSDVLGVRGAAGVCETCERLTRYQGITETPLRRGFFFGPTSLDHTPPPKAFRRAATTVARAFSSRMSSAVEGCMCAVANMNSTTASSQAWSAFVLAALSISSLIFFQA